MFIDFFVMCRVGGKEMATLEPDEEMDQTESAGGIIPLDHGAKNGGGNRRISKLQLHTDKSDTEIRTHVQACQPLTTLPTPSLLDVQVIK